MNTSSRLSQAADVIRGRGWFDGGMETARVCILQALAAVDHKVHWSMVEVPDELVRVVGPRTDMNVRGPFKLPFPIQLDVSVALVYRFNDFNCVNQDDAIEVLESAADLARVHEFVSAARQFVSGTMPDGPERDTGDEDNEGDWEHGPIEAKIKELVYL
jgi:hypothetical protein